MNILGAQLQASPRKSVMQSAQQAWVSASLQNERKLLNCHLCTPTVVHRHSHAECETKFNFVNWHLHVTQEGEIGTFMWHRWEKLAPSCDTGGRNWHLHVTQAGEINSILFLFSNETFYHLSEYVNSQIDRYWYVENPIHDVKVSEWCIMIATSIIRHIF